MNSKNTTILQTPKTSPNGIIDIFKQLKLYELNIVNVKKKGEVAYEMSNEIGRKIIKITGELSAANSLEVPNNEFSKSLSFAGRFYYIQLKMFESQKFTFQLVFSINNILVKFNFKYPLNDIRFYKTNSFNMDIPVRLSLLTESTEKIKSLYNNWCLIKFDPVEFINSKYKTEFASFGSITSENLILKSFLFQSIISLRGIFISNSSFEADVKSLPKELTFKNNTIPMNFIDYSFIFGGGGNKQKVDGSFNEEEEGDDVDFELKGGNVKRSVIADFSESFNESKRLKLSSKENTLKNNLLVDYESDVKAIEGRDREVVEENKKLPLKSKHSLSIADKVKEINSSSMNRSTSKVTYILPKNDLDLKEATSELLAKNVYFS